MLPVSYGIYPPPPHIPLVGILSGTCIGKLYLILQSPISSRYVCRRQMLTTIEICDMMWTA